MRTCRNCGLPIAAAEDPVRGVAPGRVDLPKVHRSGISATVGFILVIALLLVGGSLAVSGGGGLLSGGGRFFAEASPTPTPGPAVDASGAPIGEAATETEDPLDRTIKATGVKFDYTCDDSAIKDLSRGKWYLSDVVAGLRTGDDGTQYDQIYWKMSRTTKKKAKNGTNVTMQWSTPKALQDRFGIGRVQGDRALLITFNGPVDLATNSTIETGQLEDESIDQVKRVQLFEKNGKVRTAIGLKGESCARMRATGWGTKAKLDNARVILDIERVYDIG